MKSATSPHTVALGRRKLDLAGLVVEQACACTHAHAVGDCLHGSGATAHRGFQGEGSPGD